MAAFENETIVQGRNKFCGIRNQRDGIRDQKGVIRNQRDGIRNQRDGIRNQRDGIRNQRDGIRDQKGSGITAAGMAGIRDHKPWNWDQQFFERSGIRLYNICGTGDQKLECKD